MKFYFLICCLFFSLHAVSQELREFQQMLFCTPIKSPSITSLMITRVQNQSETYPYFDQRIKFKLIFTDGLEIVASSLGADEISIKNQMKSSLIKVNTAFFPIAFYTPQWVWRDESHDQNFLGYLQHGRYLNDAGAVEFNCRSRLSSMD